MVCECTLRKRIAYDTLKSNLNMDLIFIINTYVDCFFLGRLMYSPTTFLDLDVTEYLNKDSTGRLG